jgi:hypothetical protein
MLDKIFRNYLVRRNKAPLLDPSYRPIDAIAARRFTNLSAPKLAVIFPGWHGGSGFLYDRLTIRLAKKGWAVLDYRFSDQILETDENIVIKSFAHIQKEVAKEIKHLVDKYGYQQVHLIGLSLGNVPLTMVTEDYPDFSAATLVVAGDDLALDMWHGILTQNLRAGFEVENIGIRQLDLDWKNLAPKNHLKNFAGKPVWLYVAVGDKVIRYEFQKRMAKLVSESCGAASIKKLHSGHIGTIVRFCLFARLP